jgi:hypothetical protein
MKRLSFVLVLVILVGCGNSDLNGKCVYVEVPNDGIIQALEGVYLGRRIEEDWFDVDGKVFSVSMHASSFIGCDEADRFLKNN